MVAKPFVGSAGEPLRYREFAWLHLPVAAYINPLWCGGYHPIQVALQLAFDEIASGESLPNIPIHEASVRVVGCRAKPNDVARIDFAAKDMRGDPP